MIFSIVCEELGVFGAILLLLMFGYLLYRLFMIAQNAPDLYGTLVVTGVFAHIAIQVILNLLVVLNMMPANRHYPAVYQLWRNVHDVPDDRTWDCSFGGKFHTFLRKQLLCRNMRKMY